MSINGEESSLPAEFRLTRLNDNQDIADAARTVADYSPVPDLASFALDNELDLPTTTVVSAFFPPPADEELVRQKVSGTVTRSIDEYISGIHQIIAAAQYAVIFLPPELAVQIRPLSSKHNVKIYDHYSTIWDIPHLRGRREEFYGRQRTLSSPGGSKPQPYGQPHSWGAWNAKAFLVLEAIGLDPFHTTHFAWLDARTPQAAIEAYPTLAQSSNTWPNPTALRHLYTAGASPTGAIIVAPNHPVLPPDTPYWPSSSPLPSSSTPISTSNTSPNACMQDIWSLYANTILGTKLAMARLARAQLILMERDLARGMSNILIPQTSSHLPSLNRMCKKLTQ